MIAAPARTTSPIETHGIPGTTIPSVAIPSNNWAPTQPDCGTR